MKKMCIFIFSLFFCTAIFAGNIKEIVVIGDSLSDNGRLYDALKFVPKSPPYYKGRFSNGPTWAEDVAKFFYNKSFIDTQIYAWGGATAIWHSPIDDSFIAPIILETQINDYLLHSLLTDKSKVLYIIWIGANDYLYDRQANTDNLINSVIAKISWSIDTLIKQGAQNFVVMTLPDMSKTPYAKHHNLVDRLDKLTKVHNQRLLNAMKVISDSHLSVKIMSFDVYTAFNDLLSHPEKYNKLYNTNITNTMDACWTGSIMLKTASQQALLQHELELAQKPADRLANKNFDAKAVSAYIASSPTLALAYSMGKAYEGGETPCANAQQYVFWDDLHPTETVHTVLAQLVEQALVNGGMVS